MFYGEKESNNVWMICLNCESEFSLDELFEPEEESTANAECPVCNNHSFRRSDSLGFDEDVHWFMDHTERYGFEETKHYYGTQDRFDSWD